MNSKIFRSSILVLIITNFFFSANIQSTQGNIEPVFYISLLSPNTSPARNQWAAFMENQLPKIGIGISYHK